MGKLKYAVAAAVLAAVLAVPALGSDTAEPAAPAHTISVNGTGTADAVPDISEWSFGVRADAKTAAEALKAAGAELRKVLAAVKAEGVAAADIQTQQITVFPRYSQTGETVVGFQAATSVHVVVRNQAKAGDVVDAAVEAGGNEVSGPSFRPSDADALYRKALAAAFDAAKAKAQLLAQKAGLTLGQATQVAEEGSAPPPMQGLARADGAGEKTPVEPGTTSVTATVNVTFAAS